MNGERRSFALWRPIVEPSAQDGIREVILKAFQEYEEHAVAARIPLVAIAWP